MMNQDDVMKFNDTNLPMFVEKDSWVTLVCDYVNKLFRRDTNVKYKAEVFKVINIKE